MSFNVTAKIVSQSASRALGLLIAKFKALGGMPYDVVYKTLRFSWLTVLPYGAIGHFVHRCCPKQSYALLLGVCKYTPTAAVAGDMGWLPCIVSQWKSISILWSRFSVCRMNALINGFSNMP